MFSLTSLNDVYKYLFSMSTRLGPTRSDPTQIIKYLQFSCEPKGIYRYLYLNVSIKYHSPSKLACEGGGGGEAGGCGCWVDFFEKSRRFIYHSKLFHFSVHCSFLMGCLFAHPLASSSKFKFCGFDGRYL